MKTYVQIHQITLKKDKLELVLQKKVQVKCQENTEAEETESTACSNENKTARRGENERESLVNFLFWNPRPNPCHF